MTSTLSIANAPSGPVVFVLDQDLAERESLKRLVATRGWRPETFASAPEFLLCKRPAVPCCLVLDSEPAGISGLEVQRQMADQPAVPVIFITGCGDIPTAVQAMKAGAVEFLMKPFSDDVLLTAVSDALERSRAVLCQQSTMRMARSLHDSLTPREREVMALVVTGLLNKQVAGELGISEITVKQHRGQVMRKMRAASLPHLVTMAASLGLRTTQPDRGPEA